MGNFVVIDGNLILHKSFHIYEKLSIIIGGKKVGTGITYGVLHTIARMANMYKPCKVAIAFDALLPSLVNRGKAFLAVPSHREEIFSDYKKGRHEPGPALVDGFNQLCTFLRYMNISVIFSSQLWEADDVIAFLVKDCINKSVKGKTKIVIVSDDKDFFQLIRNKARYSVTVHCRGDNVVNAKSFVERFGFVPKNHVDYLALVGDSTDNVPGVKGIGPKAAINLLKGNVYIPPRDLIRKLEQEDIKSYLTNRSLVLLNNNIESVGGLAQCKLNMKALNLLFRKYHMASFLRESEQRTLRRMKKFDLTISA
jgi:DNA polymerase-1